MDAKTRKFYDHHATFLAGRYATADLAKFHALLKKWLPSAGKVLEIGCGSGRDALYMASLGCSVTALDGSEKMASLTRKAFSLEGETGSRVFALSFPLPLGHALLSERFHEVVAVAVLMHVPASELFEFARQVEMLLGEKGLFICSFSSGERKNEKQRLFISRTPEEIRGLMETFGLRLRHQEETPDGLGREIKWHNLVFSR